MTLVLDLASWTLLAAGGLFCVVGAVGLIRMPDFYTRVHAASVTEGAPMTRKAPGSVRTLGILRAADGQGVVRLEDRFDTDIDDLWSALTDPRRLARWLGEVEGDLREGGEFQAR